MFSNSKRNAEETQEFEFFYWSRAFYYKTKLWSNSPDKSTSKANFYRNMYRIIVTSFIMLFPMIIILESFLEYGEGETVRAITSVANGLAAFVCCYKLIVTIFIQSSNMHKLNKHLEKCASNYTDQQRIKKCDKIYRTLFWTESFFVNVSIGLYLIYPLTVSGKRYLPFQPMSPIDLMESPIYELVYLYEVIAAFLCANITVFFDTMFCGTMSMCASLLGSTGDHLLHSQANEDNVAQYIGLRTAVKRYIQIEKCVQMVSDIYSMPSLSHFIYNCGIMGFSLYNLTVLPITDFICISMIAVSFTLTFTLGMYSYFGQEIVTQTIRYRDILYSLKWYEQPTDYKRMILLSLQITQNELHVSAGKLLPLTLGAFAVALKAVYTFYAFLVKFN